MARIIALDKEAGRVDLALSMEELKTIILNLEMYHKLPLLCSRSQQRRLLRALREEWKKWPA